MYVPFYLGCSERQIQKIPEKENDNISTVVYYRGTVEYFTEFGTSLGKLKIMQPAIKVQDGTWTSS